MTSCEYAVVYTNLSFLPLVPLSLLLFCFVLFFSFLRYCFGRRMKEKKKRPVIVQTKFQVKEAVPFNTGLDSEVKPKINSGGKEQERHSSS